MIKVKRGQIYKSKTSPTRIKIIRKYNGNGHWTCYQLSGGKKSHHIHENTLKRYYEKEGK